MTRMSREEREELYDPGRISFKQAMKEITAVMKANPKLTPSEAETIVWKKHTKKMYDPRAKLQSLRMRGKEYLKHATKEQLREALKEAKARGGGKRRVHDPAPKRRAKKGSWIDFVKSHKYMKNKKGQLDLKAISRLWRAQRGK